MDFNSWSFILFLLAGLVIWIPVFLLIPIQIRTEGKWVITAASFLLAMLYFGAAQIMPIWQAVLITALLLSMCAYFLHQKGASLITAFENAEEDTALQQDSYFKSLEDPFSEAAEPVLVKEDAPVSEQETEQQEDWDMNWFEGEQAEQVQPEPQPEEEVNLKEAEIEDQPLEEEFDFETLQMLDTPEDQPVDSPDQELENRDFLNELSELAEPSDKLSEDDSIDGNAVVEAEEDHLNHGGVPSEAAVTEEERKVFESWFEEDRIFAEESIEEEEESILGPEDKEAEIFSIEEEQSQKEVIQGEAVLIEGNIESAAGVEKQQGHPEPAAEQEEQLSDLEQPEELEEQKGDPESAAALEEQKDDLEPAEELEEQQSAPDEEISAETHTEKPGMPDDLLDSVRQQLLVLKETSAGHDFNAIMDDVLVQSKGPREYFVFVQLYLHYLAEAGQEIQFSNVYDEALEILRDYPYLTEQLSWIQQQKKSTN